MKPRDDMRLGQPLATGRALDHICPICNGEGDSCSVHCLCDGLGVITAVYAAELAAYPDEPRLPIVPLDPVPPYTGKRCHDCAFKPGSMERDASTARDLFDHLALANTGEPFYCHQGMHHGAQGYVPRQRDKQGVPVGHPICAGWVREYERSLSGGGS